VRFPWSVQICRHLTIPISARGIEEKYRAFFIRARGDARIMKLLQFPTFISVATRSTYLYKGGQFYAFRN